jgi:hypothetical protein
VVVLFPNTKGGCTEAQVQSWTDTEVIVVAPPDVGTGCVGFARRATGDPAQVIEAASTLAGELERCVGMAASPIAYRLRTKTLLGVLPCPPCLPTRANHFEGGGPVIDYLLANGGRDVTVEPDTPVTLTWSIKGTPTTWGIGRSGNQGPFSLPARQLQQTDAVALGPFTGSAPADATYYLSATNACGNAGATATVHLRKTPKLSISGIEVVQAIQTPMNTVSLVAGKRTIVRVFVDSGIRDGFDGGSGPNRLSNVRGALTIFPTGGGFGSDAGPPINAGGTVVARPATTFNRNLLGQSLNFEVPLRLVTGTVRLECRVFVDGHAGDVGGPWTAFSTTTVTFVPGPVQMVKPILVADPIRSLPAPSLSGGFNPALQGARTRYPIAADGGFTVNLPPIPTSTIVGFEDLATRDGWRLLLHRIRTMLFLFGTAPTGGIRCAIVPNAPQYGPSGLLGIGTGGPGSYGWASFVCMSGDGATLAHEMGHTLGIDHAPCGLSPGEAPDPALVATTEDVGIDVPTRTVIRAGTPETMCGTATATDWVSISGWNRLRGALPI